MNLRTPLHEVHRRYGGRMVSFDGWEMPIQYSGIAAEHQSNRRQAGLFDASQGGGFDYVTVWLV